LHPTDILRVDGLKTYLYTQAGTVRAVDNISFRVAKDEAVGLIGESGCGKSMTALSLMRLIPTPPAKTVGGKVVFRGEELLTLPEEKMRKRRGEMMSMIFQDPMTFLNPVMKVKDQIAEVITLHQNVSRSEAREKAIKTLEMVNMPSPRQVADYYPHQLSGGMRQRVVIAAAISCNPALLIADEPTTALDVTVQSQILALINRLKQQLGMSLLLISHDLGIVADVCDRVYVMYAGKIVEGGDVYQIFEKPMHPYTKGLLAAVMSIDELKREISTIPGDVPHLAEPPPGCRFHPRCKVAKSACRSQEPSLREVEPGHVMACWLDTEAA
jgi:oligopeptide/dipeptide ABC transporter ATP-binding protein